MEFNIIPIDLFPNRKHEIFSTQEVEYVGFSARSLKSHTFDIRFGSR